MYYVYILTNTYNTVLYIGVTNHIARRLSEHRKGLVPGFTKKYNVWKLVHIETTSDVYAAISREKQLKGWLRRKKISLIESLNPQWNDLAAGWGLLDCHPERSEGSQLFPTPHLLDPLLRSG